MTSNKEFNEPEAENQQLKIINGMTYIYNRMFNVTEKVLRNNSYDIVCARGNTDE